MNAFYALLFLGFTVASPLCEIENGFDIQGQDLKNVGGSVESCCSHCEMTKNCLAWAWNNYRDGTCWLKSGADTVIAKEGTRIGRLQISSNAGALYKNVDIVGNDIGNATAANPHDCIDICKSRAGCRAFSWNDYNSGTCWLKSKRDGVIMKDGIFSADVYSSTWPFADSILLFKSVGAMEIRGTVLLSVMGYSCLQMCKDIGGACVGVTEINMHHTMCTLYSKIIDMMPTNNPYARSWVLITPE